MAWAAARVAWSAVRAVSFLITAKPEQRCRYAVSFLLGELMVFSLHGILFLGRIGMLRVSHLPSLSEDLLHLGNTE
jgi:hypothetical protein